MDLCGGDEAIERMRADENKTRHRSRTEVPILSTSPIGSSPSLMVR